MCFAFVCLWHGFSAHIIFWSAANFVGISLEAIGDRLSNNPRLRQLEVGFRLWRFTKNRHMDIHGKPILKLWSVTCQTWSRSVTCYSAQVTAPRPNRGKKTVLDLSLRLLRLSHDLRFLRLLCSLRLLLKLRIRNNRTYSMASWQAGVRGVKCPP